jgi:hypothetical protein
VGSRACTHWVSSDVISVAKKSGALGSIDVLVNNAACAARLPTVFVTGETISADAGMAHALDPYAGSV